jgi:hypothetical protein
LAAIDQFISDAAYLIGEHFALEEDRRQPASVLPK